MFGCFAQRQSIVLIEEADSIRIPYGFTNLKALEIYQEGEKIFFEISSYTFRDSIDLSGNSFDLLIRTDLNDSVRIELSMYCYGTCKEIIVKTLADLIPNDCMIDISRTVNRNGIDYVSKLASVESSISNNKLLFEIDKEVLNDSDITSLKRNLFIRVYYKKQSATCDAIFYSDFLIHGKSLALRRGLDSSSCPNKRLLKKDYTSIAILPFKEIAKKISHHSSCVLTPKEIKIVDSLFIDWGRDFCFDLKRYRRQYIPMINAKGEKIIFINAFCGDEFEELFRNVWKKYLVVINDDDGCILNLFVNLTKRTYTTDLHSNTK